MERKFSLREDKIGDPELFVVESTKSLLPGRVLDLAAGDGRNSIFLAKAGFSVTAADISSVGLDRLKQFAKSAGAYVHCHEIDLDDLEKLTQLQGPFQNICIILYRPSHELWSFLPKLLDTKGRVLLASFNREQNRVHGFPEKFCLQPKEFLSLTPELDCLSYRSFVSDNRYLDGYVFAKQS